MKNSLKNRLALVVVTLAVLATLFVSPAAAQDGTAEETGPEEPIGVTSDIVNGTDAKFLEFPYTAYLVYADQSDFNGNFCTGVTVGLLWVLTSAGCVDGLAPSSFDVVVGGHSMLDPTGSRMEVCGTRIHPEYDSSLEPFVDLKADLALVRLCTRHYHPTAALSQNTAIPATNSKFELTGWGSWGTTPAGVNTYPIELQKTTVFSKPLTECIQRSSLEQGDVFTIAELEDYIDGVSIAENEYICGGNNVDGAGCFADWGAPIIQKKNGKDVVTGITSLVNLDCESSVTYATNVARYINWIEDTANIDSSKGLSGVACGGRFVTILGDFKSNKINGTDRGDTIWGGAGRDSINGFGGNDVICGGDGNDILVGGDGNDVIIGGHGRDRMNGGQGKDTCIGNGGKDKAASCEKKKSI